MALGRHGNVFLWGFAADPSRLTESARRVFLNAVAYMDRFDGAVPLVTRALAEERRLRSRDWMLVRISFLRQYGAGEDWVRRSFPEEVARATGLDPERVEEWYRFRFEQLLPSAENGMLEPDPDLMELGLSNRRLELLDWLAAHLAAEPQGERALRLAGRYLPPDAPRDAALGPWIERHRERLFFSDWGGYRWRLAPEGYPARALPAAVPGAVTVPAPAPRAAAPPAPAPSAAAARGG
jgi:hypothetical protein